MQNTYTAAALAQKAFAKIIVNKKLNTLRLLVTFNPYSVTQKSAEFATGDICNATDSAEYVQYTINKALNNAKQQLKTNNIVFVA
jgi:hypothetical protein